MIVQPDKKRNAVRAAYRAKPDKKRNAARAAYRAQPDKKRNAVRAAYRAQPDKKRNAARAAYRAQPDKKRNAARAAYRAQPDKKRNAVRAAYRAQPDKKRNAARAAYRAQPDKKRNAVRAAYRAQPDKKRVAVRAAYIAQCAKRKTIFKAYHKANRSARLKYLRKYHCCTKRKPVTKAKYRLAQPTLLVIDQYVNTVKANAEAMSQLEEAFKARHCGVAEQLSRDDLEMTVCRLIAQRIVSKSLQVHKEHAGLLLGSLKSIKSIKLNEESDFGKSCHTRSTEPFAYDAAYQPVAARDTPIPIHERGEFVVAEEILYEPSENVSSVDSDSAQTPKSDSVPKVCQKWPCHKGCRPLSVSEVDAILDFRSCLELSVEEAGEALAKCDLGCPFVHSTKLVGSTPVSLKGHPIVCYTGDSCTSTLRILRAAPTHFPVLRKYFSTCNHCSHLPQDLL